MKTDDILEYLGSQKVAGFEECANIHSPGRIHRRGKINYLMKLNKRILEKLEEAGYISREKSGKYNLIEITPRGVYIAHLSGELR
jgi:predicted transcriptional regulator